jgi:hypothetical protein
MQSWANVSPLNSFPEHENNCHFFAAILICPTYLLLGAFSRKSYKVLNNPFFRPKVLLTKLGCRGNTQCLLRCTATTPSTTFPRSTPSQAPCHLTTALSSTLSRRSSSPLQPTSTRTKSCGRVLHRSGRHGRAKRPRWCSIGRRPICR